MISTPRLSQRTAHTIVSLTIVEPLTTASAAPTTPRHPSPAHTAIGTAWASEVASLSIISATSLTRKSATPSHSLLLELMLLLLLLWWIPVCRVLHRFSCRTFGLGLFLAFGGLSVDKILNMSCVIIGHRANNHLPRGFPRYFTHIRD